MNRNLWLLTICQGLFLTNNVMFIAMNGLVGLSLAPFGWMATLPVMGYVVGGALSTTLVSLTQRQFGRKTSFQLGLLVALLSALLCCYAVNSKNFWLLVVARWRCLPGARRVSVWAAALSRCRVNQCCWPTMCCW